MDKFNLEKGNLVPRKYSYPGFRYLFSRFIAVVGVLFIIGIGLILILSSFFLPISRSPSSYLDDPRITLICFGSWSIIIGYFTGGIIINFFPTVWINDEGITISHFVIFKAFIPWNEVTYVFVRERWFYHYTMVLAKRITLFHKIVAWGYFHTSDPGFAIGDDIENQPELIRTIRNRALYHSEYYKSNLV
jgi:hypothetical protein